MNFWQQLQIAGGSGGYYPWILLGAVLSALVLQILLPSSAGRLRGAAMLALLSLPGLLICALLLERGQSTNDAAYRWLHFGSQWLLAVALISLAGVVIFRIFLPAMRLPVPPILRDTLLGIAYIVVAISLLSRHDVNLSGIIATSAVVTAIIGFSLQDTLGNIMGGIALQMEKSIAVGDWIRLGEVEGLVHEIRWRQTSIETRNWDTVVIPNSLLMKSQVTILGRRGGKPRLSRIHIYFNVDFRHSPAQVVSLVTDALRAHAIPNVATDPAPNCILMDFKDSYASYAVRYWIIDLANDSPTNSEIRTRIYLALQRGGISLSIPAQRLFLTMQNQARREQKHQIEIDRRVAALRMVSIFEPLTEPERRELAEHLTLAPFREGEVMTRQGALAHHLSIMVEGTAEVLFDSGNDSSFVSTLKAGDVFGEMGLLTGEARTATVLATSDCVCYKLDRAGFAAALQRRPELAEEISKLLAKRKQELETAKAGIHPSASTTADTQRELLKRIRNFFRLE